MTLPFGLNFGLGALPLLSDAETRSICAENPDGAKAGGAKAEPGANSAARELGRGWKVRPCITVKAGETVTLADVEGPGIIQHIWITVRPEALAGCVLRVYWDEEETPCVETPLGDFFACGHGLRTNVTSLPVAVNPTGGLNSYWPMPFRARARITVETQWHEDIGGFFYQITYALTEVPGEAARCPTAGGVKARSSSTPTATRSSPPSVAPARRTTSAGPGASVGLTVARRPSARPSSGCHSRHPPAGGRCLATECTAGTSWTPSASRATCG